jgi:hypothetical protein
MINCKTCKWYDNLKHICNRDDIICNSEFDEYEPKEKEMDCIGCQRFSCEVKRSPLIVHGISGECDYYISKEKEVEKIHMTEAEARSLYMSLSDFITLTQDVFIRFLEQLGIIRKSELEMLVEEAEEMYKKWLTKTSHDEHSSIINLISKQEETIQALKSQLKEWGGER